MAAIQTRTEDTLSDLMKQRTNLKDSRSGRDSCDTNTSSLTSRGNGGTIDRPSILGRLQGYRARLDSKSRSGQAREKTRDKTKQR